MNKKWLFIIMFSMCNVGLISASDSVDSQIFDIMDRINQLSIEGSDNVGSLTSSFVKLLQGGDFQVYQSCHHRDRVANFLFDCAKKGNADAAYALACLTERDMVTWKEDQAESTNQIEHALDFYHRAAQSGHQQALSNWEALLQRTDTLSTENYKQKMFDVAATYYHHKQYDQALPRFVISEMPEASNFIGDYFKSQGKMEAALGWYGKAARGQYKNARVVYWHIINQFKRKQNTDVIKAVYKDSELQYKIGCMLEKDEQLGHIAALPWYYAAAELGHDMAKLSYLQICYSLSKKNRDIITPQLVIRYLTDIEKTSVMYEGPIYIKIMEKVGIALLNKGEWGAVTYLKKAADYSKKRCEVHGDASSKGLHIRCLLTLLGNLSARAALVPEDIKKDCVPYAQELSDYAKAGVFDGDDQSSTSIKLIMRYGAGLCSKYAS